MHLQFIIIILCICYVLAYHSMAVCHTNDLFCTTVNKIQSADITFCNRTLISHMPFVFSCAILWHSLTHTHSFYFSLSILYISSCVRCRVIGWKNGNRLHLTACIFNEYILKTHFSIFPIKKPVNRFRKDLKWTLTGGTKTEPTISYVVIDKYWFNFFLARS